MLWGPWTFCLVIWLCVMCVCVGTLTCACTYRSQRQTCVCVNVAVRGQCGAFLLSCSALLMRESLPEPEAWHFGSSGGATSSHTLYPPHPSSEVIDRTHPGPRSGPQACIATNTSPTGPSQPLAFYFFETKTRYNSGWPYTCGISPASAT